MIITPTRHYWTKKQILQAGHDFEVSIKKYFGEVWRIKSDGEYKAKSWDCYSPVAIYGGLWRICQIAIHSGATRAAGKIELRDHGTCLRFLLFYDPKERQLTLTPKELEKI